MNRAERKRQAKLDEKLLQRGIDSASQDAEPIAAMARQLHASLETALDKHNIDPAVRLLHTKVEATLEATRALPIACKRGCSHCCHSWVSAPAPEVLYLAKRIRAHMPQMERVTSAHAATRNQDTIARKRNPVPCPLLEQDICTLYGLRPIACRFAASADAGICLRVFRQGSAEAIPSPVRNLRGRGAYQIALAVALKGAGLPHAYYELNAALARALSREDAEAAWLSGEDIFLDVQRDPSDVFAHPQTALIYTMAFGERP
jgi:hypothetical protein